jgi:hypothetical protein
MCLVDWQTAEFLLRAVAPMDGHARYLIVFAKTEGNW